MIERALEKIYEAPLNPPAWADAVQGVAPIVGAASGGQFHVFDLRAQRTVFSCAPEYLAREVQPAYNAYYKAVDPRTRLTAHAAPGTWHFDQDHFDLRANRACEAFDFLVRHEICYSAIAQLAGTPDLSVTFGVFRGPRQRPFELRDRAALRPLTQHLIRAAGLTMRLDELRRHALAGMVGLNALPDAVAIIDARGRILFQNHAAQQLFTKARAVMDHCGSLRCANASDSAPLTQAIKAAVERSIGSVLILRDNAGQPHVSCRVLALPQSGVLPERGAARQVLIVMRDLRLSEQQVCAAAAPYGLTSAEARVAQGLLTGLNAKELARELGVSIDTVRTQIRQILMKTNTRRQPQALAVLRSARLISRT